MSFSKNIENFICENCNYVMKGDGYTNHCNLCIYSKHVDINPGDRKNTCLSLMKPIAVAYTNKSKFIIHQCLKCGGVKKNKIQINDSIEQLAIIASKYQSL